MVAPSRKLGFVRTTPPGRIEQDSRKADTRGYCDQDGRPRRSPNSPVARQARAIKQDRIGSGKSFVQVRRGDFTSHGVSSILPGSICGAGAVEQDTLSELETTALLQARSWGAIRLLTQFALRTEDYDPEAPHARGTSSIAEHLGHKHPRVGIGKAIMTTDLVATAPTGEKVPFFVRYERDLPEKESRQAELLQIASDYWRDRGTRLVLYTERWCASELKVQLLWAAEGLAAVKEECPAFLAFLARTPGAGSLLDRLSPWGPGFSDALRHFKRAVAVGRVAIQPSQLPPTIHQPIKFRVRTQLELDHLLLGRVSS